MRTIGVVWLAALVTACTHVPTTNQSSSLVLAEWRGSTNYRDDPGCTPGSICLYMLSDGHFQDVLTLSGRRMPLNLTAMVEMDAEPLIGRTVLAAIQSEGGRPRSANILHVVGKDESQACFRVDDARSLEFIIPNGATRVGDEYCIPLL